jgi:hypothetical protein
LFNKAIDTRMKAPIPTPNRKIEQIEKGILSLLLVFFGCGGILLIGFYPIRTLLIATSAPWVAQQLAPPPYPTALLLSERQFARSTSEFVIQRHYYTADAPDQVLLYMREYLDTIEITTEAGTETLYSAFRQADSGWGRQLAELACTSSECRTYQRYPYPRFALYVYPAPDDSGGTHIEYEFTYPAP